MPATPQAGSGGDEQWGAAIMTPPRADASGRTWAANQQISAPAVQLTGLDKTKALKVVGAHPELSRATKSIGTLLVEHYNIRTHRCDPGLERLARQSGFSSRTVRRAIDSFEEVGLIHSDRHGGHNLTSSYTLNWDLIRLLADKFESRAPDWWRSDKAANSVTEERTILSETGDRNVHQNPGRNLEKETLCAEQQAHSGKDRNSKTAHSEPQLVKTLATSLRNTTILSRLSAMSARRGSPLPNSKDVAARKAEERWNADLWTTYRGNVRFYGGIIEAITPDDTADATAAEMKSRGGGLRLLQDRVLRRGPR